MSERTHSPAAPTTEFTPPPASNPAPRFSAAQKRKFAYVAGGTLAVAVAAIVLFQVFRAEEGAAGSGGQGNAGFVPRDPSTPLARVGDQSISWRAVAEECMARHGREILQNIINRTIIQQACARHNVTVTNAEVAKEVRRIANKFNMEPDQWFQMLQAERNITPQQYTRDIIWPMLALKKIANAKITITQEEMRKAFVRTYGPRVQAKMILFDNSRRAAEVHNELIRRPEDFSQLAQKHSIEPTSRALGGEIPPIRRYSGNKKLEDIAFKLKKGQISPVIHVGGSRYVILQSEGLTKQVVQSLDQVQDELHKQLKEEKTQQVVAQIFEKLRRQTRVDNFLTNTRSGLRQASGDDSDGAGRAKVGGPVPENGSYPRPSTPPGRKRSPKIR